MPFIQMLILALLILGTALGVLAFRLWRVLGTVRARLGQTQRKYVRLEHEAEYFRLAAEHAKDGIVIQEMDGRIVWANPAYCTIVGRERSEILGRNPLTFALPPEDRPPPEVIENFRYLPDDPAVNRLQLFRNVRGDGTLFWIQISLSLQTNAHGDQQAILVCRDVTEQIDRETRLREVSEELRFRATHDLLTRLANRAEMMRVADRQLEVAAEEGTRLGMMHIDLDLFKEINDTHGHAAGDAILAHVSECLRIHVRAEDTVARVGGDEFVVICPDLPNLDALHLIAAKLIREIRTPITWSGRQLACGGSVGAALSDPETSSVDTLLQQADFALYEAKRLGRNRVAVYDEELHQRQLVEQNRAAELREAIEYETLDCFFQPKMNLVTGEVSGFETLIRWQHPTAGLMTPADFLDIAGELGMLGEADINSMLRALEMKHRLDANGHRGMDIAFNASAELLAHPNFIPLLVNGVESRGIARGEVTIEVLETAMIGGRVDTSTQTTVIGDLAAAGFKVVLDDFGTGYAGLAHLASLPVTGVKIDKSLVNGLLTEPTSEKIARAIIDLCRDLGLSTVAEGVESIEVALRLRALGCDTMQGYWLSRPLSGDMVMPWLSGRSRPDLPGTVARA